MWRKIHHADWSHINFVTANLKWAFSTAQLNLHFRNPFALSLFLDDNFAYSFFSLQTTTHLLPF